MRKTQVDLSDYTYDLPLEKIANYPLPRRDTSKLLIYSGRQIRHSTFLSLPDALPEDAFLFFNNTRVIPARLHFKKETGADIEIFLLSPVSPSAIHSVTMSASGQCTWRCAIGNQKKWRPEMRLRQVIGNTRLDAVLEDRHEGIVRFSWDSDMSFAEVIRRAGETPLPPYIKRRAEAADRERYQTIYSHHDGAVAAPTAGLHFTPEIFERLKARNIGHDFLTLHVSAGTFQPIKVTDPGEHVMHDEQIIVTRRNLENLLSGDRTATAVGTTSMRTLESLYWYGVKLLKDPEAAFLVTQRDPYEVSDVPASRAALEAVARRMDQLKQESLTGHTSIYIRPGYSFRVCRALITNFHQPASTLILLVAAFVGDDWRRIYTEALEHDYRFLSYGDSSLLIPPR